MSTPDEPSSPDASAPSGGWPPSPEDEAAYEPFAAGEAESEPGDPVAAPEPESPEETSLAERFQGFRPLHPRVRITWLIEGVLRLAIFGTVAVLADLFWARKHLPTDPGVLSAALCGLIVLEGLCWPLLRYRFWRYAIREDDILLSYGVLWQVRRSIPRLRVQHVDIVSGPFERLFGLSNLILYTAGSGDADARIPGLSTEDAEFLRERLLAEDWAHA